MATVSRTGPAKGSGYRKSRLVIQLDSTNYTTYTTVRCRIWVQTSNTENWSINLTTYGGWSSSGQVTGQINHTGGYGWDTSSKQTLIYNHTRNIDRYYGSETTISASATVSGIGGGQSPISVSTISITVPKRPITAPNTPTSPVRSRNSDTSHTVSWSASSSTDKPISRFRIQRYDGLRDPNWKTVTTVSSDARSWTDTSTRANTRYRWRVCAENDAGVSSWAETANISTTPFTAVVPTVRHTGGNNLVTVTRGSANYNVRVLIQHQSSLPGRSWSGWSTVHTTGSITAKDATVTFSHAGVDTTRWHRYRAALQNVTDSPTLTGAYSSASATIELLQAPAAPTSLSPNGATLDASLNFLASWRHNSRDGTDQIRREVRSRINGGTWNHSPIGNSGSNSWSLGASRLQGGATTEWQVRTWGEHANPSPWSATATVFGSEKPSVTIETPTEGQVVSGSSVEATWSYFDPEDTEQAQWQATLYDEQDNALEHQSGSGTTNMVTFRYQLLNNTTYKVGMRVRDGSRLWSDIVVNTFSTVFALPPTPNFTAFFDEDSGAVVIEPSLPDLEGDLVEAAHLQIWRAIGEGPEVIIGDQLPIDGAFTDYTPHLVIPNYYRVVAVSSLPSVASSAPRAIQVEEHQRNGWVYFNAGAGFERVVRVRADASIEISQSRNKALRSFVGRVNPVEFIGEHQILEGTLSMKLAPSEPTHATRDDMAQIVQLPAPICYRDITAPNGTRMFVSLGGFSHGQAGVVSDGSITFTRVEDPEVRHTNSAISAGTLPDGPGGGEE